MLVIDPNWTARGKDVWTQEDEDGVRVAVRHVRRPDGGLRLAEVRTLAASTVQLTP